VLVIDGGVVVGPPGASVIVTPVTVGGMPCTYGGIRVTHLSDAGVSHVCNGAPGAQGPVGPAGAVGPAGPAGASLSATALPTMSPQCATGGVLVGLPDGGSLALCNGATGATGAVGPAGPQGPVGATGATGAQGPIGLTGATGPTGAAGPAGPPGPVGPQGPPGQVLYLDGGVVVAPGAVRPRLAGFTSTLYTGNIGGRAQANAACAAEFPGARLCTRTEFHASRGTVAPPSPGAYLDYAISDSSWDPATFGSCNGFTSASTSWNGIIALPSGQSVANASSTPNCTMMMPLACCIVTPPVRLRGFTTLTSNGNLGGRAAATSRCAAEFPGSHLCTRTEFHATRSVVPPPSPGAFLDYAMNDASYDEATFGSCNAFTSATTSWNGVIALPSGQSVANASSTPNCTTTMPLACCD
jgi:hypothetical protein